MTEFELAWADIYWTFPDHSFDYVGKPFEVNGVLIFNGERYTLADYMEEMWGMDDD